MKKKLYIYFLRLQRTISSLIRHVYLRKTNTVFLLSHYRIIWSRSCPGVQVEAAQKKHSK